MNQTQQQFAHGENSINGCGCPALTVGYSPGNDKSTAVAEKYDRIVRSEGNGFSGIISEKEAKEAWLEMLDEMEERFVEEGYSQRDLQTAREIADKLGWL